MTQNNKPTGKVKRVNPARLLKKMPRRPVGSTYDDIHGYNQAVEYITSRYHLIEKDK